jgi:hypothetical protein
MSGMTHLTDTYQIASTNETDTVAIDKESYDSLMAKCDKMCEDCADIMAMMLRVSKMLEKYEEQDIDDTEWSF